MKTDESTNCTGMEAKLADMLLDPHAVPAKVQAHVAECDGCQCELEELKATMDLLDAWEAPEPSPYFMTRLGARMREEREAAPAGWLAAPLRACAPASPTVRDCMCVRWRPWRLPSCCWWAAALIWA